MSHAPAIETDALCKSYGSTVAVDELDLAVEPGTVYGFLGPNGAGKTTTMEMLTGLVEPTGGEAAVGGVDCGNRPELVEQIGLLPEQPPLYDDLSGREQLQFAADVRSVAWDDIGDHALSLADRLGLGPDLDTRVDGYSKGMRQKLAFVQAVQHRPSVVFLDEPTSGLDPRAAKTLRELVVELADDGTTVFLSTHILPVVEAVADTVGVLHDGRLVAEGPPAELGASTLGAEGSDGDALEDVFLELTSEQPTADR